MDGVFNSDRLPEYVLEAAFREKQLEYEMEDIRECLSDVMPELDAPYEDIRRLAERFICEHVSSIPNSDQRYRLVREYVARKFEEHCVAGLG